MNQSPTAYVGFEAMGLGCALHDALHEGFSAYRNAPSSDLWIEKLAFPKRGEGFRREKSTP